jgi:hypothetical protein
MDLRRRMLDLAATWDIKSAVVIWDSGRVAWSRQEIGRKILEFLYERFTICLTEYGDVGVIVADEPGGGHKAEKQWLADTLGLG